MGYTFLEHLNDTWKEDLEKSVKRFFQPNVFASLVFEQAYYDRGLVLELTIEGLEGKLEKDFSFEQKLEGEYEFTETISNLVQELDWKDRLKVLSTETIQELITQEYCDKCGKQFWFLYEQEDEKNTLPIYEEKVGLTHFNCETAS